jgi:hypothetical protein
MNTIDIEKIFNEVGRLHIQVMALTEENAKLLAMSQALIKADDAKSDECKPASASA